MDNQTGFEDDEGFFSSQGSTLAESESESARALSRSGPELELSDPPFSIEQLARAGRFRKPVAVLTVALAALTALAFTLERPSTAMTMPASPGVPRSLAALSPAVAAASPRIEPHALAAEILAPEAVAPPSIAPELAPSAPALSPPSAPLSVSPPGLSSRGERVASLFRKPTRVDNGARRLSNLSSDTAPKTEPLPSPATTPAVARFPDL